MVRGLAVEIRGDILNDVVSGKAQFSIGEP